MMLLAKEARAKVTASCHAGIVMASLIQLDYVPRSRESPKADPSVRSVKGSATVQRHAHRKEDRNMCSQRKARAKVASAKEETRDQDSREKAAKDGESLETSITAKAERECPHLIPGRDKIKISGQVR